MLSVFAEVTKQIRIRWRPGLVEEDSASPFHVAEVTGGSQSSKKKINKGGELTMVMHKWDPYTDLVTLREAMDRLFDQSFVRRSTGAREAAGARSMPIDLYERNGDYIVKAYLPGVSAEDVDINADQGTLTIHAHVPGEAEREEAKNYRWLVNELGCGDVARTVTLPSSIDVSRIDAALQNGILTVTIPKAEEAKPMKIAVKAK